MERTRFIEHKGKGIVLLDYSGITEVPEALEEIEKSKRFFAKQKPDNSLLTLTNVLDTRYNKEIVEALKGLTTHNKPYVKAAAVLTNSGLHHVAVTTVALFSRRTLKAFDNLETAKDWLVAQS